MNKKEYQEYEKAVNDFFEREGINCLSQQPIDPNADELEYDDPYFSPRPCDVCGGMAGDRRMCNGFNEETEEIQGDYEVCQDCEYYVEYGCLNDAAME